MIDSFETQSSPRILMVTTSHGTLGDSGDRTGVWLEEIATPYYVFTDAGASVDVASIAGGAVPVDPKSRKAPGENTASVERFLADSDAAEKLERSAAIETVSWRAYDAVFLPGGHGTMWDLPGSGALSSLLGEALAAGRVVAAVCHGPAGLVSVLDQDGRPAVAGRRVSAFTDSEEEAVGLVPVVPFLLETRLRELGAAFESAPDFTPFGVADGNLVTGQNPASSEVVARLALQQIGLAQRPVEAA